MENLNLTDEEKTAVEKIGVGGDLFDLFEQTTMKNEFNSISKKIVDTDINMQNKYGWSLLHIAIRNDNMEVFNYLMEKGADINVVDGVGWTPLMEAVMDDRVEFFKILLEKGADTGVSNQRGATAAMLIQKFGRTDFGGLL